MLMLSMTLNGLGKLSLGSLDLTKSTMGLSHGKLDQL